MESKDESIGIKKFQERLELPVKSDIQVSGHSNTIIFKNDKMYKKAKATETDFYLCLYGPTSSENLKELINLIPKFYGVETKNENKYLILENLNYNCENANVMDCKLGKTTWNKEQPLEKIERKKLKNFISTTSLVGFRVEGMLIRDNNGNFTDKIYKQDSLKLIKDKDDIKYFFKKFICENEEIRGNVLEFIILQIKNLLDFFKKQNEKCFRASSLYFAIGKNNVHQVKLIDLAYVEDSEGKLDLDLIEALEEMLIIWESLTF